jgi:hypothetical protein
MGVELSLSSLRTKIVAVLRTKYYGEYLDLRNKELEKITQ